MKTFLISSARETLRKENIDKICSSIPDIELVEAVYPSFIRIPFLDKIRSFSKQRTGHELLSAEIGCLLSHRIIWRKIVTDPSVKSEHFLVLESDSEMLNLPLLLELKSNVENNYDLFFWGAWLGHMKLFRKSKKKVTNKHVIGTPYIKSVYCTYGYSLNKKGAKYLLNKTRKVGVPVDQFKQYLNINELKLGGIQPEIIQSGNLGTYIDQLSITQWQKKWYMNFLDIKNNLICLFK
jgi:GR25 family glycosyltransferase involved in LPS biosynthesis